MYKLGPRSQTRLKGVHPDLVKVVERAIEITTVDFTVLEGLRDPARQKTLMESGASQTLNSRHITGHAVDLGAWVDNQVDWSAGYVWRGNTRGCRNRPCRINISANRRRSRDKFLR